MDFDFRELVEHLPLVVYVDELDETCTPRYVSPQIAQLLGYSQQEWLADPGLFVRSLHPDDREHVLANVALRNASGRAIDAAIDYRLIARDGRVVWVHDDEIVVPDRDGRPTVHGYMQDVTRRKRDSARIELLAEVRSLATDELPPQQLLERAAARLARAFGPLNVTFVELTPELRTRPLYTTIPRTLEEGLPIIPEVLERLRRGPVVIPDVREIDWLESFRRVLEGMNVLAAVDVPLRRNGELVAVMWFDSAEPRAWSPEDVQLLTEVAEQLAVVLERAEARAQRAQGERILRAVSRSAEHFLTNASLDEGLHELLAALGEATGASMAYVFENVPGDGGPWPWCVRRAAWGARECPTVDDPRLGHTSPAPHWESWAVTLGAGATLTGAVADLPPEQREIFDTFGSRSFAAVPVFTENEWWGFIGFEDFEAERVWSSAETDALRAAAGVVAAAVTRDRAERDLRRRDAIMQAVSSMAARMLVVDSWRDAADELLERLGVAAGVSRAYLFENSRREDGHVVAHERFEWVAAGVTPEIGHPLMQALPFVDVGLERLEEMGLRNETFAATASSLPEGERALFDELGVLSSAAVPIHVDDEWWGFIGFDECSVPREWGAAELDALKTAASLVAAAVERERAEQTLREQEQKLTAVFDTALDAIFITDDERRYVDVNPAACAYYGLPREELIGKRIDDFLPPRKLETIEADWQAYLQGGPMMAEWEVQTANGEVRTVEASAHPHFLPGLHISFFRDATERRRLEADLAHAQKLDSLGRLAGGVAHDFNNLLTGVMGYASLLLERPDADDALRHDAGEIKRAAERAAELTRQLLAFGRRQVLTPQPIDLNAVVSEVAPLLDRMVGEDVTLELRLTPDLGTVRADAAQLEQVLVNLVVNSRQAMPRGGTVTVETRNAEGAVELVVSDTGTGIDPATAARIFEPFFTTRENGVGLGLASVYGIVTQSGGEIAVVSAPDEGAEFTVRLPRIPDAVSEPQPTQGPAARTGSETILLVEDEDVVRDLARRVLERQGYTVLACPDGEAAIERAKEHAGRIDLLLTDVVMPGLRGWDVARIVERSRPEIRVVYMSGYNEDALPGGSDLAGLDLIEKPFTVDVLARRVRAALDAPAPAYAADSVSAL